MALRDSRRYTYTSFLKLLRTPIKIVVIFADIPRDYAVQRSAGGGSVGSALFHNIRVPCFIT